MARGEIHVQLFVSYGDDPKMRALARFGRHARPARDLYVQMVCYCKANLTDGYVPDEQLGVLGYPDPPAIAEKEAKYLADVGLISRAEGGWFVCAYPKRNPTRKQVQSKLSAKEEAGRRGNHERWHVQRGAVDPTCRLCESQTDRDSDRTANRNPIAPATRNDRKPNRTANRPDSPYSETETETETETGLPGSPSGARGLRVANGSQPDRTSDADRKRSAGPAPTRLPADFAASPTMIAWCREHCPDVDGQRETEAFVDYWRSMPGSKALKLDWVATWRTWMRRTQTGDRRRGAGRDHLDRDGLVDHNGLRLRPETARRMSDRARFEAMDQAMDSTSTALTIGDGNEPR